MRWHDKKRKIFPNGFSIWHFAWLGLSTYLVAGQLGSFGLFWALLGSFGLFWALGPFGALYSANEQVCAGPDFPIVAPSLSWSLYTKLHTTSSTTTTVLEKSQLLKGFQVEQKNTRVARPKSHVTPNRRPQYPKNPHYYPQKSHTVHILLFTSLIIASFYRHALVIVPLKTKSLFGSYGLFWALLGS